MGRLKLIGSLIWKDCLLFAADRRALVLTFAVPIVLASIFGIVFDRPLQGTQGGKIEVALVEESFDLGNSRIVADLCANPQLQVHRVTREKAESDLIARRASVAVVFEDSATVEVLHHPLSSPESQCVEGILTELAMRHGARDLLLPLGIKPEGVLKCPLQIQRVILPGGGNHPFNSYSHSFCGMTLQYLLFWGMECGLLFLRERGRGIWQRLRASPVPLNAIILARIGSTAGIALAQVLATFSFGVIVFGVRITGSEFGFLLLVLAISGLSAATGMAIAALGGTEARARPICILVILGISLLGGLWMPAFLLPNWVRDIAMMLPTSWAMQALDGFTWQGCSFASACGSTFMVWVFTIGLIIPALCRLRALEARRLEGLC